MSEDEDFECGFFNPALFIDEDYKEFRYQFPGFTQSILALNASSTDHDLTGQVIWPVSVFLAWFVAANPRLFRNKTVVEVGAGCGITGLVASRFARLTAVTDGSDVVMKLLAQNVALEQPDITLEDASFNSPNVRLVTRLRQIYSTLRRQNALLREKLNFAHPQRLLAHKLMWGEKQSFLDFVDGLNACARETEEVCAQNCVDVILGADVFCWPDLIVPLLQTVKALLMPAHTAYLCIDEQKSSKPVFYCGFVCRATDTRDLLFKEADQMGFEVSQLPNDFLPNPIPLAVHSELELTVLAFSLRDDCTRKIEFVDLLTSHNAC